ncbi:MAG: tyrosine-type recombinase/integrase [Gammaproteobacteria bacterium]|nr:tyrosine-type recombinase/integrase [Gammaproteobacteria bacterium]
MPPNLYPHGRKYRYKRPLDGKFVPMDTTDRREAINAAVELNRHYGVTSGLVNRIIGLAEPLEFTITRFDREFLPARNLAQKTITEYRRMLGVIRAEFGDRDPDIITTQNIADFLRDYPPRTANIYRSLLSMLFRYAMSEGAVTTGVNPVDVTIPRKEEVKRRRLTLEEFEAVLEKTAPPIRNAMCLALVTLQRREDIARFRFADYRSGWLWVRPKKVEKHGVALKIHGELRVAGITVDQAIKPCRDGVLSPWMVHQPPTTNKARRGKGLSPSSLSRGFQRARDKTGLFSDMDSASQPTFHEIRALGAKLYKEAGFNPQSLLGHLKEETTRVYLDRHEIKWAEIR